jgi:hypothetical protein
MRGPDYKNVVLALLLIGIAAAHDIPASFYWNDTGTAVSIIIPATASTLTRDDAEDIAFALGGNPVIYRDSVDATWTNNIVLGSHLNNRWMRGITEDTVKKRGDWEIERLGRNLYVAGYSDDDVHNATGHLIDEIRALKYSNRTSCYSNYDCSTGFECIAEKCVRAAKRGCFYNNPACSAGFECVNNICEKPAADRNDGSNPGASPDSSPRPAPSLSGPCGLDCELDGKCIGVSSRVTIEGTPVYCSVTGRLMYQLDAGSACKTGYQCLSNKCEDGQCANVESGGPGGATGFLTLAPVFDLWKFIARLFGL